VVLIKIFMIRKQIVECIILDIVHDLFALLATI
jgi:hypothetical protein